MTIMQNELEQLNQHALQQAIQTDQQLRSKVAPQQEEGPAVSGPAVTKQLQDLTKRSQANPQDVQGSFQGPSPDMLKMLAISHNYHEVKKATAQQKLVEMGQQARVGFMPDPKQMQKLMKQSGMKVDTSPEGIATATNYFKQYYGENDPVTQQPRGEMPKEIQGMMDKAQAGQLSRKDLTHFVMGGMIKNDLRSERYAAYSDTQKAALERNSTELLTKFTDDTLPPNERGEVLGKLAVLNPGTIGQMAKHWLDYAAGTPGERQNQIAIASGMMSSKEITNRADEQTTNAISWGMDPQMARQYGDALANNKPLPPAVQAAIPKITSTTLAQDATILRTLSETGIPGNMLSKAMAAYKVGGLDGIKNFLPENTPTQIQQQYQQDMLALEAGRLSLEGRRVGVAEREEASTIADREAMTNYRNAMAAKYGIAADSDTGKLMVEMIKTFSGIKNPDSATKVLIQQTEDAMAPLLGGQIKREKGWFGREVASFSANKGLVGDDVTGAPQKGAPQAPDRKPLVKANKMGEAVVEGTKKTGEAVGGALQLLHGMPGMP